MSKRLAMLLLLLVGGAALNVAVAWGCAFLSVDKHGPVEHSTASIPKGLWAVHKSSCSGAVMVSSERANFADGYLGPAVLHTKDLVPIWTRFDRPMMDLHAPDSFEVRVANGRGWPLLSLWCERRALLTIGGLPLTTVPPLYGGIHTLYSRPEGWMNKGPWPVDLPLRPIWPGFAINTVFYAAILWVLFASPLALRRRRRIRRGLCPACAYPVGESAVCTECGKAVVKQKAEMT